MRSFVLLFLFCFQLNATVLDDLSNFNWRPGVGESYFKQSYEYTSAKTNMTIPSILTNDMEISELVGRFSLASGLSDDLYIGVKAEYSAFEKTESSSLTNQTKRGTKAPILLLNYLIQSEYPASIGIDISLGVSIKVGDATEDVNSSGDGVGGNKMDSASTIFGDLHFVKSLDSYQLSLDLILKYTFSGKVFQEGPGISTEKEESSQYFSMLVMATKFPTLYRQSFVLGLIGMYAGPKESTDASGIKTSSEGLLAYGLSVSYQWLIERNLLISLGGTLISQKDYTLKQGSLDISVRDTVSTNVFTEMSLSF